MRTLSAVFTALVVVDGLLPVVAFMLELTRFVVAVTGLSLVVLAVMAVRARDVTAWSPPSSSVALRIRCPLPRRAFAPFPRLARRTVLVRWACPRPPLGAGRSPQNFRAPAVRAFSHATPLANWLAWVAILT